MREPHRRGVDIRFRVFGVNTGLIWVNSTQNDGVRWKEGKSNQHRGYRGFLGVVGTANPKSVSCVF